MAQIKKIINDKPRVGLRGQYNFESGSNDFSYENSTSIPADFDKFQKKDLYTTTEGIYINEVILQNNLKFEGSSLIKIDEMKMWWNSAEYQTRQHKVRCWMWSQSAKDGFNFKLEDASKSENDVYRFYDYYDDVNKSRKTNWNVEEIEGVPIVQNIYGDRVLTTDNALRGDSGIKNGFNPLDALTLLDEANTEYAVIDQTVYNPIWIIIYVRASADSYSRGADKTRAITYSFMINNLDLFDENGNGRLNELTLDIDRSKTHEDPGSHARVHRYKMKNLKVSIDTSPGGSNTEEVRQNFEQEILNVEPSIEFDFSDFNPTDFLRLTPYAALNNIRANSDLSVALPDFFVKSTVSILDKNTLDENSTELPQNFIDLQSYYIDTDPLLSLKSSAPAEVGFDLLFTVPDNINVDASGDYNYWVVDWNDKDNKFSSLDDYINLAPTTLNELLELQNQNLYLPKNQYQAVWGGGLDFGNQSENYIPITNDYKTPGIKTIKIIVINSNSNEGGFNSTYGRIGRWKLVTIRFYLDIPINQYPDFGDVGGSDYTTLPWPYTTPIIGGVDKNSKYKKSIQDTLSSGKIGDTDIIDEKFLTRDLENDEMGQTIFEFDLERVRFFNTSYDMNDLLQIPAGEGLLTTEDLTQQIESFYNPTITFEDYEQADTSPEYLATLPFPQYIEEFDLNGNGNVDFEDAGEWVNPYIERPDISDMLYELYSGGEPPSYYTYPDYVYEWTNWLDIERGINTYSDFNPYNNFSHWDGSTPARTFSEKSSVEQIFISDNLDVDLKESCKLELNTGELTGKSILDSSGNSNKGLIFGDYKVKKERKGNPMRRDSFIKVPKKANNKNGAL